MRLLMLPDLCTMESVMNRTKSIGFGMIALVALTFAASCTSSSPEDDAKSESVGSVGMNLTVAPGITLTMLNWAIRDATLATVLSSQSSGQRPWSGGAAESIGCRSQSAG